MKKYLLIFASTALATGVVSTSADAAVFGIYGANTANAGAVAAAQGNTFAVLPDLSAASLAGVQVLWVLNGDNNAQPSELSTNAGAVSSFINGGGFFLYHDRNVTNAASTVPGAGSVSFTRLLGTDIDVQTVVNPIINGPGGTITNTNLDNGNFSDHGYGTIASLPAGATAVLNDGDPTHAVDFFFSLGNGKVYYSTIPLDFYLGGGSNFATIYAPNVVAFAAGNVGGVPEPAEWALMISGFALAGMALRSRRTTVRYA